MDTTKKVIIGVLGLVFAVAVFRFGFRTAKAPVESTKQSGDSQDTALNASNDSQDKMRARDVTVVSQYESPAGKDEIGFTLTVDQAGVITDAHAEVMTENPISKKRQESFAEGFPSVVKGKKLADLQSIDKVGGSSLTTNAFNASIAKLQSQL